MGGLARPQLQCESEDEVNSCELVRVFDHQSGNVFGMPARELDGMVQIAGLRVSGFEFDFGDGPEPTADPLRELVGEVECWCDVSNYSLGFPRVMHLAFYHAEHAGLFEEVANAGGDHPVVTSAVEQDGDGEEWTVCRFPREALPLVLDRWRHYNAAPGEGGGGLPAVE